MNNIPLFILVFIVTASFCVGVIVLAAKFLPLDETQNGHEPRRCTKGALGLDLKRHSPRLADQRQGNLVQRRAPCARTARNGRREPGDETNGSLQPHLS